MFCFSLPTSSDAPSVVTGGGFFSWGTKFKYTGRTEREILEDTGSLTREEPSIQRTSSLRRKASSVPATPSTPLQPHLGKKFNKHYLYCFTTAFCVYIDRGLVSWSFSALENSLEQFN